ncbi:TetR/AcrR family transcriptional regulator [Nocardia sp. alder85J]|uniref:TetR/AcrR family transcriptional regulator n=1 Tax=Nocardia sp. alder85J TaxID=2862949 RepID=UPI001CD23BA6|nr:TetR/AcrR family transcriptional regulator [Nocardia sp. alder85J]MCX4090739.1 TetR family transcriptional regulator [Nocardia sp. alder85J]
MTPSRTPPAASGDNADPRARRGGRPTRAQATELDRALRGAALHLFLDQGYDGTSMEAIARAAGTTKASLYTRFPSKEAMFRSVLEWAVQRADWPTPEPTAPAPGDLTHALTEIAATAWARSLHPDLVKLRRIAAAQAERHPDLARQATSWPAEQLIADLLRHHARLGAIVADDPELLAGHFLAMVTAPGRSTVFGHARPGPAAADRTISSAVHLFVRGLRPDPVPAAITATTTAALATAHAHLAPAAVTAVPDTAHSGAAPATVADAPAAAMPGTTPADPVETSTAATGSASPLTRGNAIPADSPAGAALSDTPPAAVPAAPSAPYPATSLAPEAISTAPGTVAPATSSAVTIGVPAGTGATAENGLLGATTNAPGSMPGGPAYAAAAPWAATPGPAQSLPPDIDPMPRRRNGNGEPNAREQLLNATAQVMVTEGYAAATSRRVAAVAGVKPALVHYYFPTMDDLFLAVFRRGAQRHLDRERHALDTGRALRSMWDLHNTNRDTALVLEFIALANHRKEIGSEVALYTEISRETQRTALTRLLPNGLRATAIPPSVLGFVLAAVTRLLISEQMLGITAGHTDTVAWFTTQLNAATRRPSA